MTASGWKGELYGVRVGKENAAKFFNRSWPSIEVEMDGEVHRFRLSKTFWTTCPEFRGVALKKWFFLHGLAPWQDRKPPKVVLMPLTENRFKLTERSLTGGAAKF